MAWVVLGVSGVAGADWAPSEDQATPGLQYIGTAGVAYDGTGRGYVLYTRYVPFADELYLRERPVGGPWGAPQRVPLPGYGIVRDAQFDVNAAGDVVVVFGNGTQAIRRPHGGSWGSVMSCASPGSAFPTGGCGLRPSVDQNDAGDVVVAWTAYQSCNGNVTNWRVMAIAFSPATGWEAAPQVWDISDVDVNSYPSVAVTDSGNAVVAFLARNGGLSGPDRLWTAERVGGSWTGPTQRSTFVGSTANPPGIDARGETVGIAWYGPSFGAFAVTRDASGWSGPQSLPGVGAYGALRAASVAVDGTGEVHVASSSMLNGSATVTIASRPAGGGWTSEALPMPSGAGFSSPDLAANAAGDLVVALYAGDTTGSWAASALKPAGGVWPPTLNRFTTQPTSNDPLAAAAVDPWGHGLVVATPIGSGLATAVVTAVETRDPAAPPTADPPTITPGVAGVGTVLTCGPGTFAGTPPFRYAYQWLQDSVPVPAATAATFTARAEDASLGLSCLVTAANDGGSAEAVSAEVVVAPTPPANTSVPTVTGTMVAGETIGCLPGAWDGAPSPEFTFQWLRNGVVIPSETSDTYVLSLADGGTSVRCRVTAFNVAGSAVATAAARSVPVPVAPTNTVRPAVSGPAQAALGSILACSAGTWAGSPPPSVTWEWLRGGVLVPGAYQPSYTVTAADAGSTLTCRVTGANIVADTAVLASGSRTIPAAPANTRLPSVGPVAGATWAVGQVARCANGGWSNATSFAYQWNRNGAPIVGATAQDRTLDPSDAGSALGCTVTATGRGGVASATSADRALAQAPNATLLPSITGTARPGRNLTCNRGTWTNASTFAFSWLRNGTVVASGSSKYTVPAVDIGATIQCRVVATGPGGVGSADSVGIVVTP